MKLAWLALVAGCYKPAGEAACTLTCPCPAGLTCQDGVCRDSTGGCGGSLVDATVPDGPPLPDAPPVCLQGDSRTYLSGVCVNSPMPQVLSGLLDTTPGCMAISDSRLSSYCVVYGSVVTVDNLVATGTKPLVVIATDTLVIKGTLDVSSNHLGQTGAGANTGPCGGGNDGAAAADGGGGGAGGAFSGKGGNGGAVNGVGAGIAAPSIGQPPSQLVGGCWGGNGSSFVNSGAAAGGSSGGALYLMAQNQIQLAGGSRVLAVGAGGLGGKDTGGGGGGGGSGGMIVFDAMQIVGCPPGDACTSVPLVIASGGGGGGGDSAALPGQPGGETMDVTSAPGGTGDATGGVGSSSVNVSGANGGPVNTAAVGFGAGGGGGGDGFIRTFASSASEVTFSPGPQ